MLAGGRVRQRDTNSEPKGQILRSVIKVDLEVTNSGG